MLPWRRKLSLPARLSKLHEYAQRDQGSAPSIDHFEFEDRMDQLFPVQVHVTWPGGTPDSYPSLVTIADEKVSCDAADVSRFEADILSMKEFISLLTRTEIYLKRKRLHYLALKQKCDEYFEEVRSTQARSFALSERLSRRREARQSIVALMDALILPPHLVRLLTESEITEEWRAGLGHVVQRFQECAVLWNEISKTDKNSPPRKLVGLPTSNLSNEKPLKLTMMLEADRIYAAVFNACMRKVKQHLRALIIKIREPTANCQKIHQDLAKNRDLFHATRIYYPGLFGSLWDSYVRMMSWYYKTRMDKYITALQTIRLNEPTDHSNNIDREICTEPTNQAFAGLHRLKERLSILASYGTGVWTIDAALRMTEAQEIENIFHCIQIVLIENAMIEYEFLLSFFPYEDNVSTETFASPEELTMKIWRSALNSALEFNQRLISRSRDVFGLLICVRLCDSLLLELQKRYISDFTRYLFYLKHFVLLQRFKFLMEAQREGLGTVTVRSKFKPPAGPLEQTRKFAYLVTGVLTVGGPSSELDEILGIQIEALFRAFERYLERLSEALDPSEKRVFLFQNYYYVATILEVWLFVLG